ncbi:PREDICTED: pellino isoform X1 [Amphimedon queenslandica]|uniref:Pellino n=1 Tax=Amphimedon queenslandica TaxID=400682 RepID=A0AAN0J1R1_AMPQE|nr:PREDICTED: pellino isoform X1 [Amphimedon queenslandica]|eukprot:XP_019850677.1 PREDICTED: pellino isoform X1 [Amphimedon queenslandica]
MLGCFVFSFVSRHTSINEEEEKMSSSNNQFNPPPPLLLRQITSPVSSQPPPILSDTDPPAPAPHEKSPPSPDDIDGSRGVEAGQRKGAKRSPLYGEIIVLGTNGTLLCAPLSPKMSHSFVLKKQPKSTGVSLIVRNPGDAESLSRVHTHTVAMTMSKTKTSVMEFGPDPSVDMFQIGRSADSAIDFVVVDTIEEEAGEGRRRVFNSSSSVSRYSCRILCEREPPYTAKLYAAAFDTNRKIQLSAAAPTWSDSETGATDGLTTNGVTLLRPQGVFESGVEPGEWREVTVMGNLRERRPLRSSREPGPPILMETNVLTDGCLIDLCGVTLMWRSAMGLDHGPSNTLIRDRQTALNNMTPQCPVNFMTLHFKSGRLVTTPATETGLEGETLREPWVYMNCGHVFGQHSWKGLKDEDNHQRTCPLCSKVGTYTKLELGNERAFFVDDGPLTHTFSPCGHVTTEKTAKYWSKVSLPYLASQWISCCPFCSSHLCPTKPLVKLFFN